MSLFEVLPDRAELEVRSSETPATCVRFFDWSRVDEYEVVFAVEAVADGLRACIGSVTVSVWDGAGNLSDFLSGLARDFRGWEGERIWLNNRLVLTATFGAGGHVHLGWTLRFNVFTEDSWECTLTTTLEAGEQMSALAAEAQAFLHQG
ncbi:DUF6228 family protein [Kitasatospora sp. NPDC004669]|uniref:DUF6228 family protein n=1 Tax=Kitasatospora sp. NPDC004669 TaxID=3154555 RepID=UPI0033AB9ED5